MKSKIIVIIVFVIALGLIGTGVVLSLTGEITGSKKDIVDVQQEIEDIQSGEDSPIHSENVYKYSTVEDAVLYLKGIYETESVEVTYNDGIKARIKVFNGTENEVVYNYLVTGGDLIIE